MYDDLTGLKIGDRIYTQRRFSDMISIHTITGETPKAWVLAVVTTSAQVRKKDGYLMGSDSGGRFSDKTYYRAVTPEIIAEHRRQILSHRIQQLGAARVSVDRKSVV